MKPHTKRALVDHEGAKAAQYFIPVFGVLEEFHEDLVYNPTENKVLKNKSCLVFSSELSFVHDALMEQFLNNDYIIFFPCERCFLLSNGVGGGLYSLAWHTHSLELVASK